MSHISLHRSAIFILATVLLVGGGCTKQMRKNRLLAKGDRDFAAGAYNQAELEYLGARRYESLDPVAVRQLGILYFNEGVARRAYPYLKLAAEQDPHNQMVQIKLAEASVALGSVKAARDTAKGILQAEPSNEEALLLLADTARLLPEEEETKRLVDQLSRSHPDCAGYHEVVGRLLFIHHDLAGAEKEFRRALELDPKSAAGYEYLGSIAAARSDPKQAAVAYRTAASLSPLRSARRLLDIDFRRRTGDAAEATKDLAALIDQAPDFVPALVDALKIALDEKRFADCEALLEKIFLRDSGNYDALYTRGELRVAQGDKPGAVTAFEQAERMYGHSSEIKYQLALAYLSTGAMAKCEDELNQELILDPMFIRPPLLLAELALRKGDAAGAVLLMEHLLQRNPDVVRARLLLAQAYYLQGDTARALALYRRLTTNFPKDPALPYFIGVLLAKQKLAAEARASFEQALTIDPLYPPALVVLVDNDLAEKHLDAAAARVDGLIQKNPKSAEMWQLRSKVDQARQDFAAGETDLLQAIKLDPGLQPAYLALAQLYLTTHQSAQAVERLTALVAKTKDVTAQMFIGSIHEGQGQFETAAADYQVLLGFDPKFVPALNNLACLDADRLGKLDEAYSLAVRAQAGAPDSPSTQDTLGWVLYLRGDAPGALALVQKSVQNWPGNLAAQFHLGMIHCRLGEDDPARQALQLALAPTTGAALDADSAGKARRQLAVLAIDPGAATPAMRADLEARAQADPNDPIVLVRLGAVQAKLGDSEQAAATLASDLKVAPRHLAAMLALAQLYSGPLHDPAQARALAKTAHEIAPNDPRVSETLGVLIYAIGDYPWSASLLEQAAQAAPDRPELQYEFALSQYSIGRVTEAADILKRLLSGGADFARRDEAARLAAMIAAGSSPEKAEAAAGEARDLLQRDPGYLPAMMVSALALEHKGDAAGAGTLYEKLLAADPDFTAATRRYALILARRTGDDQKAYDLVIKAQAAYPDDPAVVVALGIVDYRRGDYPAAVPLLQQSLRKNPADGETLAYLGMSHLALKETNTAKAELERALELDLPALQADDVRHALDSMKSDDTGEQKTDPTGPGIGSALSP